MSTTTAASALTWSCKLDRSEVRWVAVENTIYVDPVYIQSKCPVHLPYNTPPSFIFVEGKNSVASFEMHSRSVDEFTIRYYSSETKVKLLVET